MSAIRSILLHADSTTPWKERMRFAADVAAGLDADLTTLYAPNSAWADHPLAAVESPEAWAILREGDAQRHHDARKAYDAALRGVDQRRLFWADSDELSPYRAVVRHAFAADLLILGQQAPGSRIEGSVPRAFVGSVLMDSGRPALIVPYIGTPARRDVAMVAWKDTRESARALTAAIPFLQRASRVYLSIWSERDGAQGDPADVAGYLRKHGVEAHLRPCGPAPAQVGESILTAAADLSADLLVMGCYGHSRARERVFGGATRAVLDAMTIPVLMAH
jgi:nucleotide-binding universal stress UspA family protein